MASTRSAINLPRFLDVVRQHLGETQSSTALENVRHLQLLADGHLNSVHEDQRSPLSIGRRCVLKVFKRSLSPWASQPPTESELFHVLQEIRVLTTRRIQECDLIVTLIAVAFGVFAYDPLEICPALKLEQADLGSLQTFQTSLSQDQVGMELRIQLAADVAFGLSALHSAGIIHGSLDPTSVVVFRHPERQYMAKLCGFGSSYYHGETALGSIAGSKGSPWIAPEIREFCAKQDELYNSDVYSLGLLFWQLFVHKDPFSTFDLPLDPEFRDKEIRDILRVPYLHRIIPLAVEHETGDFLGDKYMTLFMDLFANTVRLSPQKRSLQHVLVLLGDHTGRALQTCGDETVRAATSTPADTGEIPTKQPQVTKVFDQIRLPTTSLRKMPWIVMEQLFESCRILSSADDVHLSHTLVTDCIWIVFLCHFYGIGTEKDISKAHDVLRLLASHYHPFALHLSEILEATAKQSIEPGASQPVEETFNGLKINEMNTPDWRRLLDDYISDPETHEIKIDRATTTNMCIDLAARNGPAPDEIGGDNTLLHAAVFHGLLEDAKRLLERPETDINARNANGDTALIISCQQGHVSITSLLLSRGADVAVFNHAHETALYWMPTFDRHHGQAQSDREAKADIICQLMRNGTVLGLRLISPAPMTILKDGICPAIRSFNHGRFSGEALLRATLHADRLTMRIILGIYKAVLQDDLGHNWTTGVFDMFHGPLQLACELHISDSLLFLLSELHTLLTEHAPDSLPAAERAAITHLQSSRLNLGYFYTQFFHPLCSSKLLLSVIGDQFEAERLYYHGREPEKFAHAYRTMDTLRHFGFLTPVLDTLEGRVSTLHHTISLGTTTAAQYLLSLETFRSQVNTAFNVMTPVHEALNYHRFDMLCILIRHGAHVDLRGRHDPQHCLSGSEASYMHVLGSLRYNDGRFAEVLLKCGIPATICDNQHGDALSLALYRGAFGLVRYLLNHGESLNRVTSVGVSPLGSLFFPVHARQVDDLPAALRLLLSLEPEGSDELFIISDHSGASAIHVAALKYNPDPIARELLEILLAHYWKPEHLNAKIMKSPTKSTPLQMATQVLNPVAVELLLKAGADYTELDFQGRTCLDLAYGSLEKLVYSKEEDDDSRNDKFERVSIVVRLLAEKRSWPGVFAGFPLLFEVMETSEAIRDRMRQSIHRVRSMRKLENEISAALSTGYSTLLKTASLPILLLAKYIIEKWGKGTIHIDVEYRVLAKAEALNARSYDSLRDLNPWLLHLPNARLSNLRLAAEFEWLLDHVIAKRDDVDDDLGKDLLKFALSRDPRDLLIQAKQFRHPPSLLPCYQSMLAQNDLLVPLEFRPLVERFVKVLLNRDEALKAGRLPLPEFDEEFAKFHFDTLQGAALDEQSAVHTIAMSTRCRCFHESVGTISRFELQALTRKVAELEDRTWVSRVIRDGTLQQPGHKEFTQWMKAIGISKTKPNSLLLRLGVFPDMELLQLPSHRVKLATGTGNKMTKSVPVPWPKLNLDYQSLDLDRKEIRLLTLVPAKSEAEIVRCRLETFSLDDLSDTHNEFRRNLKEYPSPRDVADGWKQLVAQVSTLKPTRYNWGDFTALSYTWGKPDNTLPVIINDRHVVVGANLESALRTFRGLPEFASGLKLWVDAICINQADLEEKSKVLRLMQRIYQVASKVTVWLGPDDECGSPQAEHTTETIRKFVAEHISGSTISENGGFSSLSNLTFKPIHVLKFVIHVLPALANLMNRQYWMRLWIIQELMASAPDKDLYIGQHRVSWSELGPFLHLYYNKCSGKPEFESEDVDRATIATVDRHAAHALRLASWDNRYSNDSGGFGDKNLAIDLNDWSVTLNLGVEAQVSDDHDRVYGLLGLLPREIVMFIRPDYTKSIADTFIDLSMAVLRVWGHDDLFPGRRYKDKVEDLPTWAIDMTQSRSGMARSNRASGAFDRANAIASKGGYFLPVPDRGVPKAFNPSWKLSKSRRVLTVSSVRIDVIESMGGYLRSSVEILADRKRAEETEESGHSEGLYEYVPSAGSTNVEEQLQTVLLRILTNEIRHHAAGSTAPEEEEGDEDDDRRQDDYGSPLLALFSIPWFENETPNPVEEEVFSRAGWSGILSLDTFQVFQRFRLSNASYPLWGGRKFRDLFPSNTDALLSVASASSENAGAHATVVRDVLESVAWVVAAQRFLVTQERRYLGATLRETAKEGDVVFVLPGCSYPVILRELEVAERDRWIEAQTDAEEDNSSMEVKDGPGRRWYEVIGECYVEGIMNGEVLKWVEDGEVTVEEVNLV
ncbi:hypothetical protein B0H66DRAFT_307947 [Apodospora peruviana]|uniref:Protein kinase domain-containing protein n=1 Tax=Apodospora peruviana TaxID=516989 RepID=A0AAE0M3V3_9PEZI|nr:hypothetical protein B0H66DRAFT_307947 [Apodospora peruviana]